MSALLTPHQLAAARRPSMYSGLTSFTYSPKGTDAQFECWLEYTPADRGSRGDYGLQMEPDYPADATLCRVEVAGEDVYELLSQATIDEIETAFLERKVDGYDER